MKKSEPEPVRSFRIEKNILKELAKISHIEKLSINAIVNRVLRDYVKYFYGVKKMDGIIVLGEIFEKIINSVEEERLISIAHETGEKTFKLYHLAEEIFKDPWRFCNLLRDSFCYFANWARYSDYYEKEKVIICLSHNRGLKWSIFLKNFIEGGLSILKDNKIDIMEMMCYENMLILHIRFPILANNSNYKLSNIRI